MSENTNTDKNLDPPPIALSEPNAVEVLRVWTVPGSPQQLTLRTTWKDPGAWGLMMVDIARHAAKAYANQGKNEEEAFQRILQLFNDEISSPTDVPEDITDK